LSSYVWCEAAKDGEISATRGLQKARNASGTNAVAVGRTATCASRTVSPTADALEDGKGDGGKDEADERADDARDDGRGPMTANGRRHGRGLGRRVDELDQVAAPGLGVLAEVAPFAEVGDEIGGEAALELRERDRGLAVDLERQEIGAVGRRRRAVAEAELDRERAGRVLPELKGCDGGVVGDVVLRSRGSRVSLEVDRGAD
jgi:hypothetical protein